MTVFVHFLLYIDLFIHKSNHLSFFLLKYLSICSVKVFLIIIVNLFTYLFIYLFIHLFFIF